MMVIKADGYGEIAFGAMQVGLDIEYNRTQVCFTWEGFDEMDEMRGTGFAELQGDGIQKVEFAYHLGNDVVLKAEPTNSSTA